MKLDIQVCPTISTYIGRCYIAILNCLISCTVTTYKLYNLPALNVKIQHEDNIFCKAACENSFKIDLICHFTFGYLRKLKVIYCYNVLQV